MDFWFRKEAGAAAPALVLSRDAKDARPGPDAGETAPPYVLLRGRSLQHEIVAHRVPDPSILI